MSNDMMEHKHRHGGRDRHFAAPDGRGSGHGFGQGREHGLEHGLERGPGRGHGSPGGRRPFDYGDLRLIVLGMIAETPRHGYELMKAIEARTGGGYTPSPGVIYPTLSWLEDMGYAASEAGGGRRSYRLTDEGAAFLAANREAVEALDGRLGAPHRRRERLEPVMEAMGALKSALRARFARGPVDEAAANDIAAAIRAAAEQVGATMAETETVGALQSEAVVTTPKAAGYAAQLAKHFGHKVEARFEDGQGEVAFPFGRCGLEAQGERLSLTASAADVEALARVEEVIASHLRRFAFREELVIEWARA
ncbi:MAG: DUF2218 domain-containing protein [Amaricoccus sp.]|uniref:DUF2218 domain-containing protein n=1 Tax=Amaricoccus sp. TaxID=1872485 RepID=UPI0039E22B53